RRRSLLAVLHHGRSRGWHPVLGRIAAAQGVREVAAMLPPWRAHVDVWVILGSLAAAYLIACRRHAERTGVPVSDHARRLFLAGVAVLWIGADWPIHDLAERYLFLVHMTQHLLFTLVAAPLLVA